MKFLCISFFISLVLILSLYSILNWRILPDKLGKIYPSFAAKEGCSCLFVAKGSEEYCKDYVKQFFKPDEWIAGKNFLSIKFSTSFSDFHVKAVYRPKLGCNLGPIP
ncbi:hypothetical protein EHQ64_03060 [Leptospira sarikeiensis]|uniref:Uncharacterized protein n=1 Tax=Leptospira sarikeiensis TaxID=2484943 RepID=A0A4R9KGA9_9LEPT|nr:hypothetical protein EHQ64_03060 [Leptospira sarikeiensis]